MNWVFRFQRRGNRRKILFTEWIKICCVLFFCFDVYFSLNFISWIECKLGNTKLWDDIQLDDGFWTADLWHRQWPLYQQCHNQCLIGSVTSKKLPNAYKSCSKSNKSSNLVTLLIGHLWYKSRQFCNAKQLKSRWIILAVWPDLAKFYHFGKILLIFGKFLTVFFLFGKMLNLLWQICYITGIVFIIANGQILKHNLTIWSHWSIVRKHIVASRYLILKKTFATIFTLFREA